MKTNFCLSQAWMHACVRGCAFGCTICSTTFFCFWHFKILRSIYWLEIASAKCQHHFGFSNKPFSMSKSIITWKLHLIVTLSVLTFGLSFVLLFFSFLWAHFNASTYVSFLLFFAFSFISFFLPQAFRYPSQWPKPDLHKFLSLSLPLWQRSAFQNFALSLSLTSTSTHLFHFSSLCLLCFH